MKVRPNYKMKTILAKLAHFEVWSANYDKFKEIWKNDERMAQHLWQKFTSNAYGHSLLKLWTALDSENKKILSDYLEQHIHKEGQL